MKAKATKNGIEGAEPSLRSIVAKAMLAREFGHATIPTGLTAGGKLIYRRTLRAVETCNALAELADIGQEAQHVR